MSINEVVCGIGVQISRLNCLAFVELAGPVTGAGLLAVKAFVVDRLAVLGWVNGFLVSYVAADVMCTLQELRAIVADEAASSQVAVPAAMLVRPDQFTLFQAHMWDVAWLGVVRGAFTEISEAQDWISCRAQVAAQAPQGVLQAQ